jgi:hypothetical protein
MDINQFIEDAAKLVGLTVESGETGVKRKTAYWMLVRLRSNYRREEGTYRSLSAVANALCWELDLIFSPDWRDAPKSSLSIKSKTLHDQGLALIEEWDQTDLREKGALHSQTVLVSQGRGFGYQKFIRNVRSVVDGVGVCLVGGNQYKVKYSEEKQVWFQIL